LNRGVREEKLERDKSHMKDNSSCKVLTLRGGEALLKGRVLSLAAHLAEQMGRGFSCIPVQEEGQGVLEVVKEKKKFKNNWTPS